MSKFKAGDKVYCPVVGGEVLELQVGGGQTYPVIVDAGWTTLSFTQKGFEYHSYKSSAIFHATKENHAALSTLFPEIKFELPPLTNNEVVQNMLKDDKPVMCYLSDDSYDMAVFSGRFGLVGRFDQPEGFEVGGEYWQYVVPMTYSDVMSKIGFVQENA